MAFSTRQILRLFEGLDNGLSYAIAVSGGSDSLALMHLFARWCSLTETPISSQAVLTVDHGLRPEAASEAAYVAALARKLGFQHTTLKWTGAKPETGIQAAAREARYMLMTEFCREAGVEALLTAHTLDDQAETVLLRLARGSGVNGLAAMRRQRRMHGVALLRPLLSVSRARLRAYLRADAVQWVDDPANENMRFERVRLRRALQSLRRDGINAAALSQSARRLARASDALDHYVTRIAAQHLRLHPAGYAELAYAVFEQEPAEIAIRLLGRIIAAAGGTGSQPRMSKLEELRIQLPRQKRATLGRCLLEIRGGGIRFFREPGRFPPEETTLNPGGSLFWDGRFKVWLTKDAPRPVAIKGLGREGWRQITRSLRETGGEKALPPAVAAYTTPCAWQTGEVIAAPILNWPKPGYEDHETALLQAAFQPQIAISVNEF